MGIDTGPFQDFAGDNKIKPVPVPEWLRPKKISDLTTTQPAQILRGMLYKGCKGILMGGSKSFKTWTLADLAFCVANGLLWWGIHTLQTAVVYLDFELLDYDFRFRMDQIAKAHGKGKTDKVHRIGLRGKNLKPEYWSIIFEFIKELGAGVVVCDPTYKLLGPHRDENAAGDVAQLLALLERITEETGAAEIHAQHFSKGNQSQKEAMDRAAGSGVFARDADCIIVMTKHKEGDECLSVETILRSFPRIDPFVVRWNIPLFERDGTLDPKDLKEPGRGSEAKYSVNQLITCLGRDCLKTVAFKNRVVEETGMSKTVFYELLSKGEKSGLLHKSKTDGEWEVIQGRNGTH